MKCNYEFVLEHPWNYYLIYNMYGYILFQFLFKSPSYSVSEQLNLEY